MSYFVVEIKSQTIQLQAHREVPGGEFKLEKHGDPIVMDLREAHDLACSLLRACERLCATPDGNL